MPCESGRMLSGPGCADDVAASAVQEGALLVASPKLEPCSVSAPPGVLLASSTRQQGVRGADYRASLGADRRPPRKLKQVCVALDPQAGLPSVPAPADVLLPANREEITVYRTWQDAATRHSGFIHQEGCSAHIGRIRENRFCPREYFQELGMIWSTMPITSGILPDDNKAMKQSLLCGANKHKSLGARNEHFQLSNRLSVNFLLSVTTPQQWQ
nr:uncharacterized protein LOC129386921 [Dermacentor andersoni]XP_054931320.1 uncharacterized protein LOC129386921 [Dermacentor andersoni]XP_054931321.1 uncharacterized protein LOC129386921 [Dermacentor andersoni]XP_054931322.1 uncharacterized protein LOC129386921 [Dermacentor andersoni]XP_054931323.1 uncharacterized protein LOC129386921 [Dermacentor andersoni]XP_054931324.1 uncharacterized protein LOC129386921 [Dermacentor andersoni]XP_054931325.1 uncharacterized protein LOC129386921 [Dermac